jgi:hypothetical protein
LDEKGERKKIKLMAFLTSNMKKFLLDTLDRPMGYHLNYIVESLQWVPNFDPSRITRRKLT